MKNVFVIAAGIILFAADSLADRIAWDDGRMWEGVRIGAYRLADDGQPEFYVEPTAEASPADLKPGWFSGARRVEFDREEDAQADGQEAPADYPAIEAIVTSVVQADLLRLETGQLVRLLGVDTPITTDPEEPLEFYGSESFRFTQKQVEGRRVRIEFDRRRMDNYGRLLGYVYVLPEEKFLNLEIVETGHGHAWTGEPMSREQRDRFEEAETLARSRQLGLWDVEKREAAHREWQFVKPKSSYGASENSYQSSKVARRGSSGSRAAPRRRGVQVDVDFSYQSNSYRFWPNWGSSQRTEYRVRPH